MAATKWDLLECKAYGHAWEPTAPVEWFAKNWDKALHSVCTRCETTKVDDLDYYGRPMSTIYYYSDRYRQFLDRGLVDRASARNELWRRRGKRRLHAVS